MLDIVGIAINTKSLSQDKGGTQMIVMNSKDIVLLGGMLALTVTAITAMIKGYSVELSGSTNDEGRPTGSIKFLGENK